MSSGSRVSTTGSDEDDSGLTAAATPRAKVRAVRRQKHGSLFTTRARTLSDANILFLCHKAVRTYGNPPIRSRQFSRVLHGLNVGNRVYVDNGSQFRAADATIGERVPRLQLPRSLTPTTCETRHPSVFTCDTELFR